MGARNKILIMENLLFAICAFILEVTIVIVLAVKRPLLYIFSSSYRDELQSRWMGRSRILFYMYVFCGIVLLISAIAVIWFWVYSIFFVSEPDLTSVEKLKKEMGSIFLDAVKEASESR